MIQKHPKLLGIGIDESTAILVRGNSFEVVGKSKVFIHDAKYRPATGDKPSYTLSKGDPFDLKRRRDLLGAC